jgi:MAC/Perforin domain
VYGFNIFGAYSFDSAIQPLLQLGTPASWKAPSGTTYNVPANVTTPGGSSSSASAALFATSSAFSEYFQNSASVSGSIGAFSASFGEIYNTSEQNSSDYCWALMEADFTAWRIGIDYGAQILLGSVTSDPDWSDLPSNFDAGDPNNVLAFYRFFQKYGTHFINRVTAGGTLYYYFAVSQAASYTSTQIGLSATAEYQGLICSGQAQANAYWGQCAANWTSNRQSHAVTVPATTGVINWVNPPAGTYDQSGNFAEWKTAVVNNPSRCNFSLPPIWELFSGSQSDAIKAAYAAYASNRVQVQASIGGTASILLNSKPIFPDGGYPPTPTIGWQLLVANRKSLEVILNKYYKMDVFAPNWPDSIYQGMIADLQPYVGNADYMLVAATSVMDWAANPNTTFYVMLKSFGAGTGLDSWNTFDHGYGYSPGTAVYALIGAGASTSGVEAFGEVSIAGSPTAVTINALLLPTGGSFVPTPYQP